MNTHGLVQCLQKRPFSRWLKLRCYYASSREQSRVDARQHLQDIWIPTVNINKHDVVPDATQLLIRAGYLRQAYAGIFHMLPLGLRVQQKLESLIDKHMTSIGASKVSLSSISSQKLWQRSGRFKPGSEMFTFADRRDGKWLLAPTHEEEITNLLADIVSSDQDLPIRLYQISRKYRDEKRPRGGLLRGREFIMKDLYTFDRNIEYAISTYDQVREAYRRFLDELKVNYVEARADSGNMGGNLSHEYHFPNSAGEDNLITCSNCQHARNEEFVESVKLKHEKLSLDTESNFRQDHQSKSISLQDIISKDGKQLVRALAPVIESPSKDVSETFNYFAIKAAFDGQIELDTGIEDALSTFNDSLDTKQSQTLAESHTVHYLLDGRLNQDEAYAQIRQDTQWLMRNKIAAFLVTEAEDSPNSMNLHKVRSGDACPECKIGKLGIAKAIEIGHTFHLGRRYSSKLGLSIRTSPEGQQALESTPVEMGCHGIGVSRLIAAVASCLSDEKGLNWPRVISPFEVAILVQQTDPSRMAAAESLYDKLNQDPRDRVDVLIDDRKEQSLGWKLKDADMIGYPVLIVVGKSFAQHLVEVQCRRLGIKEEIDIDEVPVFVRKLLEQL